MEDKIKFATLPSLNRSKIRRKGKFAKFQNDRVFEWKAITARTFVNKINNKNSRSK